MNQIYKSILLGIITVNIWIAASYALGKNAGTTTKMDKKITEKTDNTEEIEEAFMQTLTIDYKGAIN